MIEIDGSIGGGQVLRTAIGLSALTGDSVKITKIRTNRAGKQGLRPQHMMGVKIAGELCEADIRGLKEGSTEVEFKPKRLNVSSGKVDIGTAGSVTLLLQTILPILIFTEKPISIEIKGGTEVQWSPTIQYYQNVLFPLLNKIGASLELKILSHGYYPKGKGAIRINSDPARRLNSWNCVSRGEIKSLCVDSVCGNLPKDNAKIQGEAAVREFQLKYPKIKAFMSYKSVESLSPGSSCTCYAICENSILGSSSLGERALKPEVVGQEASEDLLKSLDRGACLDKYMADQILPYLALAKGKSSVSIEGATDHFVTNIHIIEKMLPVKFWVKDKNISVGGVGWIKDG